ncbi:hypothetical protein JTZ62_11930 [Mammaliicoccus sciuri]|jgi:hypothetical protein|uniref:hypothetical protein n=1 Tax=Mammaliicoccus sciuri TaxID=1296 RepID=UPI0019D3F6B9|nr:hypothetical protein [Mammaliicoccus sciuri]MEB8072202.1 hypothetical protein [Mammaliicoccus sciuri]QSN67038.1 hypothetical protein JTZ62_11930 [Mammaliicoccus sciuri]UIU21761.1 hypothetical protein LLZ87_11965 [Mammaliicoccus sciuri]UIU24661.1 hypothetical protein LLZ92_11950 [Mammaliicoccus sciuri]
MRNIQFADELIKKTFGESEQDGVVRKQFNATDKHVTWSIEFFAYEATITCTVSEAGSKYKISGDNVPTEFMNLQYERVNYIREELFKDSGENPDQLTIEDVDNEEEHEQTENETLFDGGEEKVEELSNEEIE